MAQRTHYTPGTFSWIDLTTPDQAASKRFYGELLGWSFQDLPVGEGAYYSMAVIDGQPVAAIAPQPDQQRDAGVPPLWNSYITVDSADAAVDRARADLCGPTEQVAVEVVGRVEVGRGELVPGQRARRVDEPGAGVVTRLPDHEVGALGVL